MLSGGDGDVDGEDAGRPDGEDPAGAGDDFERLVTDVLADAAAGIDVEDLARAVHALGPGIVVVTGGHREEATDVFFDGDRLVEIPGERHPGGAAHGSGCTHSSALAAHLALGFEPLEAARRAKAVAAEAVRNGLREVGRARGRWTSSGWRPVSRPRVRWERGPRLAPRAV